MSARTAARAVVVGAAAYSSEKLRRNSLWAGWSSIRAFGVVDLVILVKTRTQVGDDSESRQILRLFINLHSKISLSERSSPDVKVSCWKGSSRLRHLWSSCVHKAIPEYGLLGTRVGSPSGDPHHCCYI